MDGKWKKKEKKGCRRGGDGRRKGGYRKIRWVSLLTKFGRICGALRGRSGEEKGSRKRDRGSELIFFVFANMSLFGLCPYKSFFFPVHVSMT